MGNKKENIRVPKLIDIVRTPRGQIKAPMGFVEIDNILSSHKKRRELVDRLERIFPNIELHIPAFLFNNEEDCAPANTIDWHEFIERLKKDGLEIKNIKGD